MDLVDQLESDLAEAMRLREEVRISTLRLLKSSLKNYQIDLGHDLTMQEALSVLQKEAKKHQDSIRQYTDAKREDLAKEEQAELDIIEKYLPEQMPKAELEVIVDAVIKDLNASGPTDMGKVISRVRQDTEGKADGAIIAEIAKTKLAK